MAFIAKHPILIGIGVALVALAFFLAWRKHAQLRTGHLAHGEVVDLVPVRGSKGGTSYKLVVAYTDTDGQTAQFTTSFATNPPMHAQGEKVRVVCYPGKTTPDIFTFHDLFLFPWLLFCVGGGILVCSAGFIWGPAIINHLYFLNVPPANSLQSMGLIKS